MYQGFPADMLRLLSCPTNDGGQLRVSETAAMMGSGIGYGTVCCDSCSGTWSIEKGILRLYNPEGAHSEAEHERILRDRSRPEGDTPIVDPPPSASELAELNPVIRALEPLEGATLLEFGSGAGRFTVPLAPRCRQILAVDFSFAALRHTARKLPSDTRIALVQADITRFATAPGVFDRALSTLTSNLPSREHRLHMYRVASEALTEAGRFISTAHHSSLMSRLYGVRPAWRYADGDIFRYYMTRSEICDEATPYFARRRVHSIRVFLPVLSRFGLAPTALTTLAGKLPGLRMFGRLLLSNLEKPVRPIAYGELPRVPTLLRGLQTQFLQRSGPDGW